MKNKEYSMAMNWHYIAISTVFAAVIMLLVLYMPDLREYDSAILNSVKDFLKPFPPYIPAVVNEIGKNYYLWPLIASGSVLISHKYYLETFLLIFFTQMAEVLTNIIKDFICRERPCGDAYPGYSFPSGHSLDAMCFYGILIYYTMKHVSGFWRYFLISIFVALIFLSGISRLWVGVHFLTDVLEGMFLGFILVNICILLDKFFSK